MRESWDTGRFWFNYASRKSLDIDVNYLGMLHKDGTVRLDEGTLAKMRELVRGNMQHLAAYEEVKQRDPRFDNREAV